MSPKPEIAVLEERLGHDFRDPALLELALSHPSHAHEVDGTRGNERLEFLGDAVIDLVVADLLFAAHPDWEEGDLTRTRSALVNTRSLANRARLLGIDQTARLGRTELTSGGRSKDSILANVFEAVLGALYLDGSLESVVVLLQGVFGEELDASRPPPPADPKTRFQEWVHAHHQVTPTYLLVADSQVEDDDARFTVEVQVEDRTCGQGQGRTKRLAERRAAEQGLDRVGAESV